MPQKPPHEVDEVVAMSMPAAEVISKLEAFLDEREVISCAWYEDIQHWIEMDGVKAAVKWTSTDDDFMGRTARAFRRARNVPSPASKAKASKVATPPFRARRKLQAMMPILPETPKKDEPIPADNDEDGSEGLSSSGLKRLNASFERMPRQISNLSDRMAAAESGRTPRKLARSFPGGSSEKDFSEDDVEEFLDEAGGKRKSSGSSDALRKIRKSSEFMIHELFQKVENPSGAAPATVVAFFGSLAERLTLDARGDEESEIHTSSILADLKMDERQTLSALRTALQPLADQPAIVKQQCEAVLVNELQIRSRNCLVRELKMDSLLSAALQKLGPFVREQVGLALKHTLYHRPRTPTPTREPFSPGGAHRDPQGPPRRFNKGDGGYGTRANRFGEAIVCNECRQPGHFAWECETKFGPQPRASGGGGGQAGGGSALPLPQAPGNGQL